MHTLAPQELHRDRQTDQNIPDNTDASAVVPVRVHTPAVCSPRRRSVRLWSPPELSPVA